MEPEVGTDHTRAARCRVVDENSPRGSRCFSADGNVVIAAEAGEVGLHHRLVAGAIQVAVTCDPLDLLQFLKHDFMPMNRLCEQAGMFEERIYDRTKALFEYFNLPFATEPPAAKCF